MKRTEGVDSTERKEVERKGIEGKKKNKGREEMVRVLHMLGLAEGSPAGVYLTSTEENKTCIFFSAQEAAHKRIYIQNKYPEEKERKKRDTEKVRRKKGPEKYREKNRTKEYRKKVGGKGKERLAFYRLLCFYALIIKERSEKKIMKN